MFSQIGPGESAMVWAQKLQASLIGRLFLVLWRKLFAKIFHFEKLSASINLPEGLRSNTINGTNSMAIDLWHANRFCNKESASFVAAEKFESQALNVTHASRSHLKLNGRCPGETFSFRNPFRPKFRRFRFASVSSISIQSLFSRMNSENCSKCAERSEKPNQLSKPIKLI